MARSQKRADPTTPADLNTEPAVAGAGQARGSTVSRKLTDREDLLAEGVNLRERGRITDPATDREWIAGWRDQTALSLFDGVDPVFQFNTSGQLRRVFLAGQKLAADAGQLAQLTRRSDSAGRLVHDPHILSAAERERVLQRLVASALELNQVLASGNALIETIGITPNDFTSRLQEWLVGVNCIQIAHGPGVVG